MSIKEELSRLNLVANSSVPLRSSPYRDLIVPAQVLVHASFSQLIFARYFIRIFDFEVGRGPRARASKWMVAA